MMPVQSPSGPVGLPVAAYPAALHAAPDGVTVTFRDVPEAITCGRDRAEALSMARDALETGLSFYVERKAPLPEPSAPLSGEVPITLSALGQAKAALYNALMEEGLTRKELSRRLNWHMPQLTRVLDFCHDSRLDAVEAALAALGRRLVIATRPAPIARGAPVDDRPGP